MLKRVITGAGYVAVMVLFFLLRELVDVRLFHILTAFLAVVGTFEVARAVKKIAVKGTFYISVVYGALIVPVYCIGQYWAFDGFGWVFALDFIALGVMIACVNNMVCGTDKRQTFLFSFLPYLYPAVFIAAMLCANDSARGFTILLLSFVISPLSDTFAYFVGSLIKGPKLCPKLSPKKTWSGAIGGTLGGIVGALIVYFILPVSTNYIAPVLVFIIAGVLGSIINIFGDLFESFIKRRAGIKDMGKLLPGHGGVMDRIDGTSFVIALIYLLFLIF